MTIYYSATTGGFYATGIHTDIPHEAVEITPEQHTALLTGQSEGKRIVAAEDGSPVLQDPPAPTTEQLAEQGRADRNRRLAASDWTQLPDAPADKQVWAAYRQSLREISDQAGFPVDINWPNSPV